MRADFSVYPLRYPPAEGALRSKLRACGTAHVSWRRLLASACILPAAGGRADRRRRSSGGVSASAPAGRRSRGRTRTCAATSTAMTALLGAARGGDRRRSRDRGRRCRRRARSRAGGSRRGPRAVRRHRRAAPARSREPSDIAVTIYDFPDGVRAGVGRAAVRSPSASASQPARLVRHAVRRWGCGWSTSCRSRAGDDAPARRGRRPSSAVAGAGRRHLAPGRSPAADGVGPASSSCTTRAPASGHAPDAFLLRAPTGDVAARSLDRRRTRSQPGRAAAAAPVGALAAGVLGRHAAAADRSAARSRARRAARAAGAPRLTLGRRAARSWSARHWHGLALGHRRARPAGHPVLLAVWLGSARRG